MNLSHLRTPPPLRDSDYAAIRARVLSEIAQEQQRRPFRRLAFAFAAAAVIVVVLFLVRPEETTPRHVPAPAPVAAAAPLPAASPVVPAVMPAVAPPTPVATAAPSPVRSSTPAPARVARRVPPKPRPAEVVVAEAAAVPMSIEIHTADPDIRIIWIVNQPEETRESS